MYTSVSIGVIVLYDMSTRVRVSNVILLSYYLMLNEKEKKFYQAPILNEQTTNKTKQSKVNKYLVKKKQKQNKRNNVPLK